MITLKRVAEPSESIDSLFDGRNLKPEGEPCKGLYYRASCSSYGDLEQIGERVRLRLLKRRSCPGCDNCWGIIEILKEYIACDTPPDLSRIEHGKIYTPSIRITSTGWETGYADEWEVQFTEVEEEE